MKIHGKMGKPGPDAKFWVFVKSWEAQKIFSTPVFLFHVTVHIGGVFPRAQRAEKNLGALPRAKRAEKIFKVYLRERSERKILCWDCARQVFLHILDGFYLKRVYKGTLLVVNGACFGDWPI